MSQESDSLTVGNDPYFLLQSYKRQCKVFSYAYSLSEAYYRYLYKVLTYPVIILTTTATVFSGFEINNLVLVCINILTLLLIGFNTAINPKNKEILAHQCSGEFGEIYDNITHFILENSKTKDEYKEYSNVIHEQMNIWKALSPPIKKTYMIEAQKNFSGRIRKTNHTINKKKRNSGETQSPDTQTHRSGLPLSRIVIKNN